MKNRQSQNWSLALKNAKILQANLAKNISKKNEYNNFSFICGCDMYISKARNFARAATVILDFPAMNIVEIQTAEGTLDFPYIPGLLSFRELPLLLEAMNKLVNTPDLIFVDGQGIAHPRRFGIASHLGLVQNIPTIGCGKSRLIGWHKPLTNRQTGIWTELLDKDEIIGAVLITKMNTSPVYVSIGHKIDLPTTIKWTLLCCNSYRLPEPIRLAHIMAGGNPLPNKYQIYNQINQ